jgi:hypothetical protein
MTSAAPITRKFLRYVAYAAHSPFFGRCSVSGLALLIVIIASSAQADAKKPRSFQSRVVATWDNVFAALPPEPFGGLGKAKFVGTSQTSHMGRSTQSGTLILYPDPNSPPAAPMRGDGFVTITAANGDELTFKYEGLLYANGEGTGTFTFTEGTGRFVGATGGGKFYAQINLAQPAPQPMTVLLDGRISY